MSDTELYNQLIADNKALFESGHYEASYHLLCAAKHLAGDMDDEQALNTLLQLAHQQSDWINMHAPDSKLSQRSSTGRNRMNLYTSLFGQLKGRIEIAESNHIREHLRDYP